VTWDLVPLHDVLERSIGGVWGTAPGESEIDVRVIRVTELKSGGRLEASTAATRSITAKELSGRRLQNGDLLLEKSGGGPKTPVGRVGLVQGVADPSVCANFMQLMRPNEEIVEPRFLHLYLNHFHAAGGTAPMQTASTNIRNIKASEYAATPVPLPPLAQQRKIVEILEDHLSRLDAADRAIEMSRQRLDRLLLAQLAAEVRQLREVGAPFAAIIEIADTSLGKMLDAKRAVGEPTPYLANINVRWGQFELDALKEVRLSSAERIRLALEPGDVLACEGGEPGRCAVWQLEGSPIAYQKALHRIRVRNRGIVLPGYLALMLRETIQSGRADTLFTGTTIKHLPQEKLRRIRLPIPNMDVQTRVVARARDIEDVSIHLRGGVATATRRSAALRQGLLSAAFSGKLTGRHTDQEVIEELASV